MTCKFVQAYYKQIFHSMTSPMLEDGLVPIIPFSWLDGTGLLRNGSREQNAAILVARDFAGTFIEGHSFICQLSLVTLRRFV